MNFSAVIGLVYCKQRVISVNILIPEAWIKGEKTVEKEPRNVFPVLWPSVSALVVSDILYRGNIRCKRQKKERCQGHLRYGDKDL